MSRRGLLIVGMAPSSSSDPRKPLDCVSGRVLASYFGHERVSDFADAVNILERYPGKSKRFKGDRFPMKLARKRVLDVVGLFQNYRYVVVLGAGPKRVLEIEDWFECSKIFGARVTAVPHPSGCNHWYNNQANQLKVRGFLGGLARELNL